jgi:hypothetical protein
VRAELRNGSSARRDNVSLATVKARSAVGLLAIQHTGDFQVTALVAEEYTVVLGTETNQGRLNIPKCLVFPSPVWA